jgi:hypothetical protein
MIFVIRQDGSTANQTVKGRNEIGRPSRDGRFRFDEALTRIGGA